MAATFARLRSSAVLWWLMFLVCAFYGAYALYLGVDQALALLGLVESPPRSVPLTFVVHASAGGAALISGSLQLNSRVRQRWPVVHRTIGRVYVGAAWLASAAALWVAIALDASVAAKLGFASVAVLWWATTTIGLLRIRQRNVTAHRAWMVRSFALALFFITFSTWVPGVASASVRYDVEYALGIWLSWMLNLLIAEIWMWLQFSRPRLRGAGRLSLPR